MNALAALLAGILFGSGLLVSGMNDPQRVLAFLDITHHWNPALAVTMAAALSVAAPAFLLVRRRARTLENKLSTQKTAGRSEGALWFGSALFGVGWGLSGICPGPAILLLAGGALAAWIFGVSMAIGMYALGWWASQHP